MSNKREFIADARRVNVKFTNKYSRVLKQALDKTVSSLIGTIRTDGINKAVYELQTTMISEHIGEPMLKLIREVGNYHAKVNYRFLRQEIARKAFGINLSWLEDIMNLLRRSLLEKSIIRVTQTLREHLIALFEQSIREGMSEEQTIELIREDTFTRMQAQRIARTEVNRVTNTARKVTADSFDVQMDKEWVSHQQIRTRGARPNDKKDHLHMNGQTVDLGAKFKDPKTGEEIEYPSAPEGSAAMTINCRCQMVTVPKRVNGRLIPK